MREILTGMTDPRPLAAGRIIVALVAIGFTFEWMPVLVRASSGNFLALPVIDGWPVPSREVVLLLIALSLGASMAMLAGIAGRLPANVVAVATAAVLLLEQQSYSNHLVLLMMLALFLGMSGAHCAWTLSKSSRRSEVAYWPAFLIKVLITSIYGWTAISKINPQYLSGEVLATFLQPWVPLPESLLPAAAAASIATETFLSVGLWFRKVRRLAFALGAGLHIGIVLMLSSPAPLIGFGLLMLTGYIVFVWAGPRVITREQLKITVGAPSR